jgi:hypothetical protein
MCNFRNTLVDKIGEDKATKFIQHYSSRYDKKWSFIFFVNNKNIAYWNDYLKSHDEHECQYNDEYYYDYDDYE